MDIHYIIPAQVGAELAYCFQKGQGLDISNSASYFVDHYIGIAFRNDVQYPVLNFICYMGNYLDSRSQIVTPPLLGNYRPVDAAGSYVAAPAQITVNKPFVMPKVQVCFSPVFSDKYFPMLIGAHCAGIYIDIRVKFLNGNF
ncbi:MAG: Uncharacterized protein XD78_0655 [Desulfotomaculum sp. 46_296]|nr:MAG: Uncharacterized protein XD78_0655 [Desulfotomaculum sp. 46_296]